MNSTAKGMNIAAMSKNKCWTTRLVARRIHSGRNNAHKTRQEAKSDATNEHSTRTSTAKIFLGFAKRRVRRWNPMAPNSKPINRQAVRPFRSSGRNSRWSEFTRYDSSHVGGF